jgi:hypothetical protein
MPGKNFIGQTGHPVVGIGMDYFMGSTAKFSNFRPAKEDREINANAGLR